METDDPQPREQKDVAVEEPVTMHDRDGDKGGDGIGFKTPESKALSETPEQGSRGELDEIMKYPDGYNEEEGEEEAGDEVAEGDHSADEFSEMDAQMADVYTDFLYNRAVGDFDREYVAALKLVLPPQRLTGINEEPEDRETQSRSRTSAMYPSMNSKARPTRKTPSKPPLKIKRVAPPMRNSEGSLLTAPTDESRLKSFGDLRQEDGDEVSTKRRDFDSRRVNTYSMEEHTLLMRKRKREEKLKQSMMQSNERFPELFSQTFDYQRVLRDSAQDLEIMQQEVDEKLRILREQRESRERTARGPLAPIVRPPIKVNRKPGPYLMESTDSKGFQVPRAESPKPSTQSEDYLARVIVSGSPPSAFKLKGSNDQKVVVDPAQADWVRNLMAEQKEREARKKRREERQKLITQAQKQQEEEARKEKERMNRMIRLGRVENRIHDMNRRRQDNQEAVRVQNRVVKELLERPRMFYYFKASSDAVSRVKETLHGARDPAGYKRLPPDLYPP